MPRDKAIRPTGNVAAVATHGLTHVALAVRDVDRASRFYQDVFGAIEVYRQESFAQLQTPGSRDVIVLERDGRRAGKRGGVTHFGFRLKDPDDIDRAAEAVTRAGGRIRSRGDFCPGEPYIFAEDPDGYEVEIWFEIPTPVDPRPRASREPRRASVRRPSGRGSPAR